MPGSRRSRITGTGSYLPPSIVTNEEVAALLGGGVPAPVIHRTTGIRERRYVREKDVGASGLAEEASRRAIHGAGLEPDDIDCIILATVTPDQLAPGSGVLLQHRLGLAESRIPAFDLRNQCSGFLYALHMADSFVRSGAFERVLVVGSEVHSAILDFSEKGRAFTVLFGDGAGAVVVEPEERGGSSGLTCIEIHADGRFANEISLPAPGTRFLPYLTQAHIDAGLTYPCFDGPMVFKWARRRMAEIAKDVLEASHMTIDDLDHVLLHQANGRILDSVQRGLGVPPEKCPSNIERYGNLGAASLPVLLDEVHRDGRLREGDRALLVAFGGGFTWGACALQW